MIALHPKRPANQPKMPTQSKPSNSRALGPPLGPNKELTEFQQEYRDRIAWLIFKGHKPRAISRQLSDDKKIERKLYYWAADDPDFQQRIARLCHGEMVLGLPDVTRGLVRRGASGRPDGARLLMEAMGFHNPRVQHEHSGEVTIKMDMPRPTPVEEDVPDAEVVE
jgi:hypothetical protein